MFNDFISDAKNDHVVISRVETAKNAVDSYNAAIMSGVKPDIDVAKRVMTDAISDVNRLLLTKAYTRLGEQDKPVYQMFLDMFSSGVYRLKKAGKDSDTLVLSDDGDVVLDLDTFEQLTQRQFAASAGWKYRIERFYHMLVKRKNRDMHALSEAELAGVYKITYPANFEGFREERDSSKTPADPLSNNSLVKLMQYVMDGILYEDNGSGKNRYKVTSAALPYLDTVLFSDARKGVGVRTVHRTSTLIEKISKALQVYVTNGRFTLEVPDRK